MCKHNRLAITRLNKQAQANGLEILANILLAFLKNNLLIYRFDFGGC
jgi:hypothetical protein